MTIRSYPQFPAILANYPLDLGRGWFSAYAPALKTNLCRAPSFERGGLGQSPFADVWQITDWFAVADIVTTTQTQGARCLQMLPYDEIDVGASTQVLVTTGTRYTFSFDFRTEKSDYKFQIRIGAGISDMPLIPAVATWKEMLPTTVWKRHALSFVAPTTGVYSFAIVKYGGTGLHAFYIDAVQVEEGYETSYFDGDTTPVLPAQPMGEFFQPQFYWTGEPHASPSVRTQYTTTGGEPIKFSEFGWQTKAMVGLGTPTFLPVGTPYAVSGGSEFRRVIPQEREFTLVGRVRGDSYEDLSRKKQLIQSLLAPVVLARTQPIVLEYQPTDECDEPIGCPIRIEAVYTGGFTGNTTNRHQEDVSLNFKAFTPFVQTGRQQGAELARNRSFPFVTTRSATGKWTDVVYDSGINSFGIGEIVWGLDGAIYMAQYTTDTNLALKRLQLGATTWETLQNIAVNNSTTKRVRMVFTRDWKLWITGMSFSVSTNKVGYWNVRDESFTWSQPAGVTTDFGVDLAVGYKGELYLVMYPGDLFASKIFRYDTILAPTGWKAWGTTDDLAWAIDVDRNGRIYLGGDFTEVTFNGVATGSDSVYTQSGEPLDPYEPLGAGLFGATVPQVNDLEIAPDGSIYFAGNFDGGATTPPTYSKNLIKWNGSNWESVVRINGLDGVIRRINIAPNGAIYVFGTFTEVIESFEAVTRIPLDWTAVLFRERWQPLSLGGEYTGLSYGSPAMMAISPRSGDYVLARNITGEPVLPAYTNVFADMTAWSRPIIRVRGEGTLYSIVNHTAQGDVYFYGGGLYIYTQETVTIDLSNLRPKITSDVRGDLTHFVSSDSRLSAWRIMPNTNEVEVMYLRGPSASIWGGDIEIFWAIQHATIDAAMNCSFDSLPIALVTKPDDEIAPEGAVVGTYEFTDPCIELIWEAVEAALYYEIEYSEDEEDWLFVGTTEGLTFEDCDIFDPEAIAHFYRIRAVFADGVGAWSDVPEYTEALLPSAPTSLTAVPTGAGRDDVLLAWTDNSADETGFIVEYDDGTGWIELTTTAADVETYTHTTPTLGVETHYYRVRAVNGLGESANATDEIADLLLGLMEYFALDEASGNATGEVSANVLTDTNTVGSNTGHITALARDFVRANLESLSNATPTGIDFAADFTVAGWAMPDDATALSILMGRFDADASADGYAIAANVSNQFSWWAGNALDVAYTAATYTNGVWYHVLLDYDAGTGDSAFSVNNDTEQTEAAGVAVVHNGALVFGAFNVGGALPMDGRLNAWGFWNRKLSATNKASLFNGGAGNPYPFA